MNVSVIIPVYNAEKYIKKAIESCLQLPEVKEIIVVDDGYRDGAKEIVRELALKNTIIKLYEHPDNVNMGAGPSRNLGIEKATKEYIAFLDADDFFLSNRFSKDKEVFQNNPSADGCYNAIGCHFYSEKSKEFFLKHFKSETTTVNEDANPTPNNLFRGLIGMIPSYGYFHLDGLTLKRKFVVENMIKFPPLSVHQDTVFTFKIVWYGKLYPSELSSPTACRGVHEGNRITANFELENRKRDTNRFLMWSCLYEWAKEERIGRKELKLFKRNNIMYKMLAHPNPHLIDLLIPVFSDFKLLRHPYYRSLIVNKLT